MSAGFTSSGDVTTFDYRERAPIKSTPTMYLGADGTIDRSLTAAGYLAPGVPGTVRGLEMAHRKFGKLPWKEVVMPSVTLAEGFTMSASLARGLNREVQGPMAKFPASVAAFGKPGGGEWVEGDRLVQGDLAKTLRAIAEDGPDAFYKGWIADRIAEDMQANGGIISKEDLAAYRTHERAPVRGSYKGYDIISMPPPSSGGVALVEMLNIVEPYDLKSKGLLTPPALHVQIEAMRRAYLDRARFLGDPDFSDVPVAKLTSKQHAQEVAASISLDKASSSVDLGKDIVTVATAEPDGDVPLAHGGPHDTMIFTVPKPLSPRARLRIRLPDGDIRTHDFDGTALTIGRASDNDLVLSDGRVSRHHARLTGRRGTLVYTDLGSTNGSRVNGVNVTELVLGEGDRLEIGDTVIVVEVVGDGT